MTEKNKGTPITAVIAGFFLIFNLIAKAIWEVFVLELLPESCEKLTTARRLIPLRKQSLCKLLRLACSTLPKTKMPLSSFRLSF